MFSLGLRYSQGRGVTKDPSKAAEWYRRAATKGQAPAMNNLGVQYATGRGVTKDLSKATEWYRKAATKGHAAAMNNLGNLYRRGVGVPKDISEALKWYRRAAAKDYPNALFELGKLYSSGIGVKADPQKAADLLVRAVQLGSTSAKAKLMNRPGGLFLDVRRAFQRRLKEAGVYNGRADGKFDQATRRAIEALANNPKKPTADAAAGVKTKATKPAPDLGLGSLEELEKLE
jgi:TPR repeat protein